jgi:hypothetical protein
MAVKKTGWITEHTLPGTAKTTASVSTTAPDKVSFASAPATLAPNMATKSLAAPQIELRCGFEIYALRLEEYIVIKPLDFYGLNGKLVQYKPGNIIMVSKYAFPKHYSYDCIYYVCPSEKCFYVYDNDNGVIGRVDLEKYKNVSMNTVMVPIEEWMKDYKWEQYFVTTDNGLHNVPVRENPEGNEIYKLKPGEIVLRASKVKGNVPKSPDKLGALSRVRILYEDKNDNNKYKDGWVAEEKYINENSSVKEWINIFSTSKEEQKRFIDSHKIDFNFISQEEDWQKTCGYIPGKEENGILKNVTEISGLTIATGFDIGQFNEDDINRFFGAWTKEENPEIYNLTECYKKSPYFKLGKGYAETLKNYWNNNKGNNGDKKPLKISKEQAELTDNAVKLIFILDAKSAYNKNAKDKDGNRCNFDNLSKEAKTVLYSISYKHGSVPEIIMNKICEGDYSSAVAEIKSKYADKYGNIDDRKCREMKLLYPNTNINCPKKDGLTYGDCPRGDKFYENCSE